MFRRLREAGVRIAPRGIHHFPKDGHRLHLRVEESGSGLLTVDASRVIHLNPVATDMGWLILSGLSDGDILSRLRSRYLVGRNRAGADLKDFRKVLEGILETGGGEPISFVNTEITEPFQAQVSAPYRMDLALTYRCNLNCGHCYNQGADRPELSTASWKEVLDRIWGIGVPHAIFTGGEASLREDLPELIHHAETLGMVTGLLTNGVRLADGEYAEELAEAGLDHVQITLESADRDIHNGMTGADSFDSTVAAIRNCIGSGMHTITNTTITGRNADVMADTIRFAGGMGLTAVAANAVIRSGRALEGEHAVSPRKLASVILAMNEEVDELGMRLIWYSPTRYCAFNPMEFDLGEKRCTAGEYNLCVEPDGAVLPCQSWYEPAGNILADPWDSIWNSPLLLSARNREWVDGECRECVHFSLCGGGCPLERKHARPCRDSV